jgi:hypothetical protein
VTCEKCWSDAFDPYSPESQVDRYHRILKERKDHPCTPRQQAGQWWDDELQVDTRKLGGGE